MRFKFWTNMSILFESHLSLSIRSTDSGWVFALLPEKARTTYIRTFDTINGIQPNLAPDTIMVDFELALHRSISDAFPATYLRGYLPSASTERYYRRPEGWGHTTVIFALLHGNQLELMGLPFVPKHDIAGAWTKLLHKGYLVYKLSICKFLLVNYYYYNHYITLRFLYLHI